MKYIFSFIFWSVIFLLTSIFLISCTKETNQSKDQSISQKPVHVTYRLKWLFNASVIGDLWAKEEGLFEKAGFIVDLKEGGPEQDAIKDLELGRANFGVASADQIIRAVAKGAPVKVLAQLFQHNPLQWIYRCDKVHIKTIKDLKNYRIGVTYGGNDEAILMALLSKYGLNPEELNFYAVHYDFNPFWKGLVDLWPVYKNTQGIVIANKMMEKGEQACFLNPPAYGIKFVANSLITSDKFLKHRPAIVKKFTKVLIQAWSQALADENLDRAVHILKKYNPEISVDLLKQQIKATKLLVMPDGLTKLGQRDKEAWEQTEEIMFNQHLIQQDVIIEHILTPPLL